MALTIGLCADFVLRGNHWVIGVAMGDAASHVRLPPHEPCGGDRCGQSGGACMSPLIEDLLGFGMTALPTAAQGDCGLDVVLGRLRPDAEPMEELALGS